MTLSLFASLPFRKLHLQMLISSIQKLGDPTV